jgi:hypothetical protein
LRWTLASAAAVELTVLDLRGRFVRGWGGVVLPAGEHSVDWDLRDADGRALAPGRYFVRLAAGRVRLVRPVILIR